jgi:methyl-accepting chemotaxis protein
MPPLRGKGAGGYPRGSLAQLPPAARGFQRGFGGPAAGGPTRRFDAGSRRARALGGGKIEGGTSRGATAAGIPLGGLGANRPQGFDPRRIPVGIGQPVPDPIAATGIGIGGQHLQRFQVGLLAAQAGGHAIAQGFKPGFSVGGKGPGRRGACPEEKKPKGEQREAGRHPAGAFCGFRGGMQNLPLLRSSRYDGEKLKRALPRDREPRHAMPKIFHTLRFQLPAVVLGVFVGTLFLLMLFFHEMTIILVKTRELAESAEVNDRVSGWITNLSVCARERTKLMSLGEESYLRSFQIAMNEVNDVYREIETIGPDTLAVSTCQLREMRDKHFEYMELLDGFAKDQTIRRLAARADSAHSAAVALLAVPAAPARIAKDPHKRGASVAKAGKAARKLSRTAPRTASPRIAKRGASLKRMSASSAPALSSETVKQIDLDSATNETFKGYEAILREGLAAAQETMRAERKDKLQSLRNSVGRAKDRLIYSLLLLLAMVGYVAVILKWKILDPMGKLKQGAMEIGKGSLGYQVNVTSRNEMGELAEVFNHMSLQLDQKRNAEMRLKRLEAIEQIVRSVNHEINNPLMIISGNAEFLLAVLENADASLRSKLDSIIAEVHRIFMVTQRLKEIREPITQDYIGAKDQMIDLARASQVRPRDF